MIKNLCCNVIMKVLKFSKQPSLEKQIKSFDTKIVGKQQFLMLVHADWCVHCKNLVEKEVKGKTVWGTFLEKCADRNYLIVEVDYSAYDYINTNSNLKKTLFNQLLQQSVSGFPFIGFVSNINENEKSLDVVKYDGKYPITAYELQKFTRTQYNIHLER